MYLQGLQRLQDFEFVAIFDSDFKPDSDFLVSRGPTHTLILIGKDSASRLDALLVSCHNCIVELSLFAGSIMIVLAQPSLYSMLLRLASAHADEDHTPSDA